MLTNIAVGPPMVGVADLKSSLELRAQARNLKGTDSDSTFKQALGEKLSPKPDKAMDESTRRESRSEPKVIERPPIEASEKVKAAKPEDRESKRTGDRQQAIQEFMDSFESEFKIPPTRLVEAMATLDDSELTKSPEATVDAVVDQLGLDSDQEDKARAMYAGLLVQLSLTQQAKMPQIAEASVSGFSQQNMQARMTTAFDKQGALRASVDKINDKFWMKPDQNAMPMDAQGMGSSLEGMMVDENLFVDAGLEGDFENSFPHEPQVPQAAMPKMEDLPPHLKGQMKESLAPGLLAALAARNAQAAQAAAGATKPEVAAEASADDLMQEFSKAIKAPGVEGKAPQLNQPGQSVNAMLKNGQEFMQQQNSQGQFSDAQQDSFGEGGNSKEVTKDKLTVKAGEFKSVMGLEGLHGHAIKAEALGLEGAIPLAAAAGTPATPGESDAAVKQLMSQAQYLIKKGGGEVKVEMTPEGMGTIHLKVMMQDGKVNLHMNADSAEAKKTIESSLAELKTSLAAQKLSVENVKIDVVSNVSADTATQNQTNGNGQRDQARQFWNQFNDNFGSQGRRESLADMPNLKGYGRKADPLTPVDTASKASSRAIEGKGSGLNLVA